MPIHVPVMLTEVVKFLEPKQGQIFIDATLGGGSYSQALAKRVSKNGLILSIDFDNKAIANFEKKIVKEGIKNIKTVCGNFANLLSFAKDYGIKENSCSGIVFDLGLSSDQLADKNRGFSFQLDGPLDMAFNKELNYRTIEIINNYPLSELIKIFKEYGGDPHAYRVARAIVSFRRREMIARVKQLVEIIEQAVPIYYLKKRIHPATRIFQALRIETNDELNSLKQALDDSLKLLKPEGKIVVVSFHSGEDRIVKHFFKDRADPYSDLGPVLKIITKKPIIPSQEEIKENPRSRSAKLRVAKKINNF